MKIGELPIGCKLRFGMYEDEDIAWVKVSDKSDFFALHRIGNKAFDATEWCNDNRSRRSCGNNYYPHSNIFQWLNSTDNSWFSPMHGSDEAPTYCLTPGFLSQFSSTELDAIDEQEITVSVPCGSKKEFGKTVQLSCKVTIPSASQFEQDETVLGDNSLLAEGEQMPGLVDAISEMSPYNRIMTRSGVGTGGHILVWIDGEMVKTRAKSQVGVHPMIRLKADVDISDKPDEYGFMYIPDHDFVERFMEIIKLTG